MQPRRDVALVLSGGGMTAVVMQLGFLQRLAESSLWPRIGWIYGTSAGALTGTMAALDRLDDLERFLLELKPHEAFRPRRLWQRPLAGLHEFTLPQTIEERLAPMPELARDLVASPIELVVCVTDLGAADETSDHPFERTFSSRTTPTEEMAEAVLASAAISALVLPIRVGDLIATDGGWVRNFPLGHAYDNQEAEVIVGFQHVARFPAMSGAPLERMRTRLERFRAVPPVRALIEEIQEAEERHARGEPGHLGDMISRLMRVAIARNTALEERFAREKDVSVAELQLLREDVLAIVRRYTPPGLRSRASDAVASRFRESRFPFRSDRALPAMIVHGDAGESALDASFGADAHWPLDAKLAVLARGRELADEALASFEEDESASRPLAAGHRGSR